MEYLEVCDGGGNVTGRVEDRALVHALGLPHRTVHVWVWNGEGMVLVQRRAGGKDSHPGYWDVSAAGHLEPGESPLEAALRELAEELGIAVVPAQIEHIGRRTFLIRSRGGAFIDNEITDVYFLRRDLPAGSLAPDPREIEEVMHIPLDDLRGLVDRKLFERRFVPHGREYYEWVFGEIARRLDRS